MEAEAEFVGVVGNLRTSQAAPRKAQSFEAAGSRREHTHCWVLRKARAQLELWEDYTNFELQERRWEVHMDLALRSVPD